MNLNQQELIGQFFFVKNNNVTYFDSFGVHHVPKEIEKIMGNRNIVTNTYRIQAYDLMCGCFSIGFIDLMLKGKSLLDYTNFIFPYDYEKNDKIILKYFQ